MTRSLSKIDERAARLFVNIVETEEARIAGAILSDYHAASAAPLIGTGLLVPEGPVPAATSLTDHDDEPVSLEWSPEHHAYGYFSPAAGWVNVDERRLQVYRIDALAFLQRFAARLDLPVKARPAERISGILWELGGVRLPGRGGRVPVWFARRLNDRDVWRQVCAHLSGRPPRDFRVVVTTSATHVLPEAELSRHQFIALDDLVDHSTGLVIEPTYLAAQLKSGAASRAADPVRHAAGFRHVWVGDREFRFGGDKRRQIVEYLFNAWEDGVESVSTEVMFADLEFNSSSRMRDIFKDHEDWRDLIDASGGSSRLRIRELLDANTANAD
ncbi:hypothetical protein JQU17_21915 [Ponticoccus sp. SC2-23]|uniref:hypothetical protein n=1 Tax=Alexandriicola marinus TaxID=2081710 RepID=UPI000FD7FA4D|nr:hypothetical protein [Alexandriicola marinus]MBM1222869.1 hypothetical protein [Ponticoccus sp. SC6-9]MBM1231795.1 hypothetical protein [Ponticoccus sp. SC6-38]MBM1245353.1 hypothetical protein [Ponticoccus sp. SC2-64]MBM1249868.1 hypothetical protein [Ponticoccus sp. SC6-42]MBM1263320.1 hypothetical protein [Ponticoccus sp. SC6-31]MBM1267854.1 hypothetical protein [Ponticoccus sp. SC2-67]MBM1276841.1 hypothetical protein [Ponticoccus sp. SC6-56]MBM1281364.1 hypothetical protein [Pontico